VHHQDDSFQATSSSAVEALRIPAAILGQCSCTIDVAMRRSTCAFVSAAVILACAAGCAVRQQQPSPGRLTVGVTAAGPSASTLMVTIVVESTGISGRVKADAGLFTSNEVPFGTHVVRLVGVPAACRVENGAERQITISEQRRMAVLRFDVRCG
jgi:hypothetical protein